MTKSLYLKIPIVGITDEEKNAVKGILRSLISSVYMDLEEKSEGNYNHLMKVRLTSSDKKFLLRSLGTFIERHRGEELLKEAADCSLPSSVTQLLDFYGGRDGSIPN